jgi:tRNA A-37 threonylcarbamoyl transferase component Bud32
VSSERQNPSHAPVTIGRYKLLRVIGEGGMGSVYEAEHVDLGLRVAIKTLKASLADNTITTSRFHREGVVAARLRHPNATAVFDVIEQGGASFLVMEYMEGETLKDLLDREKILTPARAVDFMIPVCSAVSAAHDEGIVHRDLKPSNLFLARERTGLVTPKVLDFGLSWTADEERPSGDITRSGVVLGTLLYMAPEQVRSARRASAASDQYAIAVILYQALSGHKPFLRETQFDMMNAVVAGKHPSLRSVRPEISPALEAVIERAMQVDPSKRFASMKEFARELFAFASPVVQAVWAPAFELPSPDAVAPAPVSNLVAVKPRGLEQPTVMPGLVAVDDAKSTVALPPKVFVALGAACVACILVGMLLGFAAHSEPNVVVQAPAPTREVTAPVPAATASPVVRAAPEQNVVVARPSVPVMQQLRVDAAVLASPDASVQVYVPRYSRPNFVEHATETPGATPK